MNSRKPPKRISCSRCQSKKIRCNRADPRCDKCEATGTECIYLSRKPRAPKRSHSSGVHSKDIISDILRRLERLEDHCTLNQNAEDHDPRDAYRSMSVDSDNAGSRSASVDLLMSHSSASQGVAHSMLDRIKDERIRSLLVCNVFCHMRNVESRFLENENCMKAMESAMAEVERLENTQANELTTFPSVIPKETARRWINQYYESYQFEAFRIPLDKSFIMAIPDLLEIPHVQLDDTSQIIYYNVILQGLVLDPEHHSGRGGMVQYLYRRCMALTESWLDHIKNTPADLLAAFFMVSMMLEGCNSELSWKILGHACTICKALGYFTIDDDQAGPNEQTSSLKESGPTEHEAEVDRNRIRFEFWHLLRTDCLFRLSFGKPALISRGSWTVNFPDPTITGVHDASTRFVQIHFLASMRLTLIMLKYLDMVDAEQDLDTAVNDGRIDSLIEEVQLIMSDWNAEELLRTTTNHVDAWFCVDILFSSYKMLIIFYQSKKCNQDSHFLPYYAVDIARKSLQMFQSLVASSIHGYWGISLILLHQFVPWFVLCLDMLSNKCGDVKGDLALVAWLNDFAGKAAEDRVELRPVTIIMTAMTSACRQVELSGH